MWSKIKSPVLEVIIEAWLGERYSESERGRGSGDAVLFVASCSISPGINKGVGGVTSSEPSDCIFAGGLSPIISTN